MGNDCLNPNSSSGNGNEVLRFRSRYYGTSPVGLYRVRSLAIWLVVVGILAVAGHVDFRKGNAAGVRFYGLAVAVIVAGAILQRFALVAGKTIDVRQLTWAPNDRLLTVFQHRFTTHFLSFGEITDQVVLSISDILSATVVTGRGRHLRLHTTRGFVSVSNDIENFDMLCTLIQEQCRGDDDDSR